MKSSFRRTAANISALAAMTAGIAMSQPARADLVFTGTGTDTSDGTPISATVDFSLSNNIFKIVLTNNDTAISPGSVLTNLGVTVAPTPDTSLPSASGTIALTGTSSFVSSGSPGTLYTLGQEWAYLSGGLASSGFGVGTGHGNLCGGVDPTLCTANATKQPLDGAAYGLVGTGTNVSMSNLKNNYYVQNSVTVDIALAAGSSFTLADITSVDFQYGTGPNEGSIIVPGCTGGSDCHGKPVPEPTTLSIIGIALAGLGLRRWRR
jgi:hypothetical protein